MQFLLLVVILRSPYSPQHISRTLRCFRLSFPFLFSFFSPVPQSLTTTDYPPGHRSIQHVNDSDGNQGSILTLQLYYS